MSTIHKAYVHVFLFLFVYASGCLCLAVLERRSWLYLLWVMGCRHYKNDGSWTFVQQSDLGTNSLGAHSAVAVRYTGSEHILVVVRLVHMSY